MKKIILFIAIAITSLSCSSDDSGSTKELTPIQKIDGKWQLQSEKLDGVNRNLSQCDKLNTYTFGATAFFNANIFSENNTNGCSSVLYIGTYTLVPNSTDDFIIQTEGSETIVLNDVVFNTSLSIMTTKEFDGPSVIERVWNKIN